MAKTKLERVLLRFADVFVAKKYKDQAGSERFSATLLMPLGGPQAKIMEKSMLRAMEEAHGPEKAQKLLEKLMRSGSVPYSAEPRTNKNGDVYDGYEGMASVSAHNKERPQLFDQDAKTPLVQADGRPYEGSIVTALLDVYYDRRFDRINAKVLALQFIGDGPRFSSQATFEEGDFEPVEEDALI